MRWRTGSTTTRAWAAAAILAAGAVAQDTRPSPESRPETREAYSVSVDGMPLETFLQQAEKALGLCLVFGDPAGPKGKTIRMTGEARVVLGGTRAYFEAILLSQGYAIVPLGDASSNLALIEAIDTSKNLKTRAPFVPVDELESWRDSVGRVVMTVIPTRYVSPANLRAAVAQMLQGRNIELVQEIPTGNALVVMGFAPTVYAVWRITEAMDLPPTDMAPRLEIIPLAHAAAEELQPIIDDILGASSQGGPASAQPQSGNTSLGIGGSSPLPAGASAPKPKVVADPRQNALLVYAVEADLDGLRSIIRKLDEEAKAPKQTLRLVKLLHTNAEDMQETLRELLGQSTGGSRTGASNRTQGTNLRATTGASSGQLGEVRIVGDRGSNSLLVSADASSWPIVKELVDGLDRPRRQIWIESAVIEMTDEDLQQIGVEITAIQNGGDPNVGFASALGLSTTIRQAGATTNALSSFQRVPFLTSTGGISFEGGVMGVFDDDFNFPALIAMAERRNKGRLVATPTILAAENAGSKLEIGTSVAFSSQNTSRAGTDQTGFGGYQDAKTELIVTPYIGSDTSVQLDIELSLNAFVGSARSATVPPNRVLRTLAGSVHVEHGRTALLGTLLQQADAMTAVGIPGLMDSPVLGALFRNRSDQMSGLRLLFFMRPHILQQTDSLDHLTRPRLENLRKIADGEYHDIIPGADTSRLDLPTYSPTPAEFGAASRPADARTEGLK